MSQDHDPKVYIVLDHEDCPLAVFKTREAAEEYIAAEWEEAGPPELWHVEEFDVH